MVSSLPRYRSMPTIIEMMANVSVIAPEIEPDIKLYVSQNGEPSIVKSRILFALFAVNENVCTAVPSIGKRLSQL